MKEETTIEEHLESIANMLFVILILITVIGSIIVLRLIFGP